MQNPKDNQNSRPNDPVWHLLAEYPLSEFILDQDTGDEPTAGLLFQTMRELGIPPEYLENIEMTLTGFAKEAMAHFNQDRLDSPVYIRVFCQKKTIAEVNSVRTSSHLNAEPTTEPTQINRHSDTKMNGGWGYFLIERGGVFTPGSSVSTYNLIDLHLYKEGE